MLALTTRVILSPGCSVVTVTLTGAADAVLVRTVPPSVLTVVVAVKPIVQVEVVPDFGAPNVTKGLALVAPTGLTVTVLALAPGVKVHW